MDFVTTTMLSAAQKEAVFRLWNSEYPVQLGYNDVAGLDAYLGGLAGQVHLLLMYGNDIAGWAFRFERNEEVWFAIIVTAARHGQGVGTQLLNQLKERNELLNGWVIDHSQYAKANGEAYRSPLAFYLKNGFTLLSDKRLETETLSAVKIMWSAGTRDK